MTLPAQRSGVVAKKLGMTRIFNDAGQHVPVTVLSLEGAQVVGLRTEEVRTVKTKKGGTQDRTDGYNAVILGAGACRVSHAWRAARNWR